MASTYATDGTVVNFKNRTTTPEYDLGTVVIGNENTAWIYVVADVAVAAAAAPVMSAAFHLTAGTGGTIYTADTAFAANEYGWIRKTNPFVA